ncbi:MAG: formate dehydrogenase accessory sulfurtransferase FdhD [Planctomycetota bacterium]
MADEPDPDLALHFVPAVRIDTGSASGAPVEEEVGLVREARLTIDLERIDSYTLLCTPQDDLALAAGFLLSEGIIEDLSDVAALKRCTDDPEVVRVRLVKPRPAIGDPGRNLLIVSSCGACGTEDLAARIASLPAVGDELRVGAAVLRRTVEKLRDHQPLFAACAGTHAAAIFDATGQILAAAEDAGRHNALDKAIGKCLLAGIPTRGRGVVLSGRVSLEMVGKCARAGLELVAAVSAATSLAVEVADRCNITLCAFVRGTRATVFGHARRLGARPTFGPASP